MPYFDTVSISDSYLNISSWGNCFAKSTFNSTNLFQGLPQGLQLKGLGSSLGFSVTWSSLGLPGSPVCLTKSQNIFFKVWYIFVRISLYFGKNLSSVWMISELIICALLHKKLRYDQFVVLPGSLNYNINCNMNCNRIEL